MNNCHYRQIELKDDEAEEGKSDLACAPGPSTQEDVIDVDADDGGEGTKVIRLNYLQV